MRAAHVICHETGHNWFGGLVQTLNSTGREFIEESTASFGEVACVASALPALENRAIYQDMFAPALGDSRGLHVGALMHALEELSLPEQAGDAVLGSNVGHYAKGAAFLHMLEGFVDGEDGPVCSWQTVLFCCTRLHPCPVRAALRPLHVLRTVAAKRLCACVLILLGDTFRTLAVMECCV